MKGNNFLARLITGAIYVGVILTGILTNSVFTMGFLFAIFASLANYEFQSVVGINRYMIMLKIINSLVCSLLFYNIYAGAMAGLPYRRFLIMALPYLAYYVFYLLAEIFRERKNPIEEMAMAFFSHWYVALPLGMLMLLCVDDNLALSSPFIPQAINRTFWLLPIFIFVWLNDTGAYLVGSTMGKHKLLERISPNKTIEGAVGGVILAALGGVAFYFIFPGVTSLFHWCMLAVIISIFSTFGDLLESFIKRTYGVKDTGSILPGHGGVLDRIDSILISAIPAFIYINVMIYML